MIVTPGNENSKFLLLPGQAFHEVVVHNVFNQLALGVKLAQESGPPPVHLQRQHGPDFKLHLGMSMTLASNSRSPWIAHNTPK